MMAKEGPFISIWSALVCAMLGVFIWMSGTVDWLEHGWAMAYILLLALSTIVPIWLVARRQRRPRLAAILLMPVVLVSVDSFFLRLGVYNYFRYAENTWHWALNSDVLQKAAFLVIVGNLALWFGYAWPGFGRMGERLRPRVVAWAQGVFQVSEWRIWILYAIGVGVRFYTFRNNLGGFFSHDQAAQADAFGYIQILALLEGLTSLSLVVYFCVQLTDPVPGRWRRVTMMTGLELFTVFLAGFKGQVIYRLIYLALAYVFIRRRFPGRILGLAVLVLAFIMPLNLLLRDQYANDQSSIIQGRPDTVVAASVDALDEVLSGQTEYTIGSVPERFMRQSAQLQDLAMAVQYVDRTGMTLQGSEIMNVFLWFIPRAIWPDKPVGALGGWFNVEVYGGSTSSAAAISVPGDFYLNFGWLAVPLGLFIYGAILRVITVGVIDNGPFLRLTALIPFVVLGFGMPSSEIGSHLAGLTRQMIFFVLVLSFVLLPKVKVAAQSRPLRDRTAVKADFPQRRRTPSA
jgi:hypothetical protein